MDIQAITAVQPEVLQAINKSELDSQVATAKAYPRDMAAVRRRILDLATLDTETAEDCFYVLRRKQQGGGDAAIEGLSVRMAEIIASQWGNIAVATRIIGNDGKQITAQAMCRDMETNVSVSVEVRRRITDKHGRTYSEDMQVVTGNAASAIAYRNAVLKVIPKAALKAIITEVRDVAMGKALDLETARRNCIANFAKAGVNEEKLCAYLGVKAAADIDKEKLFELRSTWNAIKEGTTTVEETFNAAAEAESQADKARKQAEATMRRARQAATAAAMPPRNVDPETGEIKPNANGDAGLWQQR